MFSGWSIERRLFGAFSIVTAVLIVVGTLSWMAVGQLAARSADAVAAAEGSQFITARYADHLRWVHDLDLHLLGAKEFSGQLDHTKCRLGEWLYDTAARDRIKDPELRRLVSSVEQPHAALHASARQVLDARRSNAADAAQLAFRGETLPALAAAGNALTEIQKRYDALRAAATDRLAAEARTSRAATATGSVLAVVLALALAWGVSRNVSAVLRRSVGSLEQGAREVTGAAREIAGFSQTLSGGASEQAASLEETSASMEEMAAMTRRNAEQSQEAARLMGEVDRQVARSNEALQAMVGSMASIQASSAKRAGAPGRRPPAAGPGRRGAGLEVLAHRGPDAVAS